MNYQKLAEVTEQSPIIGRDDLYYGGTGYKNDQGLGVQLQPQGGEGPLNAQAPAMPGADLIAVPITSLYDHGTTVVPSEVLHPRIPQPFIMLNPADADKQMAADGMTVDIIVNGASATVIVRVDEGIPAGFALVPRSMGISLDGPAAVEKIQVAENVTI